jgi:hypothetical protein
MASERSERGNLLRLLRLCTPRNDSGQCKDRGKCKNNVCGCSKAYSWPT